MVKKSCNNLQINVILCIVWFTASQNYWPLQKQEKIFDINTACSLFNFVVFIICSNISSGFGEAKKATRRGGWPGQGLHNGSFWYISVHIPDWRLPWSVQRNSSWILQSGSWSRYLFHDIWNTEDAFSRYFFLTIVAISSGLHWLQW